jgi:hypothetical protein
VRLAYTLIPLEFLCLECLLKDRASSGDERSQIVVPNIKKGAKAHHVSMQSARTLAQSPYFNHGLMATLLLLLPQVFRTHQIHYLHVSLYSAEMSTASTVE